MTTSTSTAKMRVDVDIFPLLTKKKENRVSKTQVEEEHKSNSSITCIPKRKRLEVPFH